MENREFLEQIQQYAVRIGNAGDKELYGSGTLRQRMLYIH